MTEDSSRQDWDRLNQDIVACVRCPRLVTWREDVALQKRRAFIDWEYWGKPLAGFGDRQARLLIVGLAPAAHGGNRTGRMFTGDSSASTLLSALHRAGFANQPTSENRHDGLALRDAFMTAVVRCAPPGNRPVAEEQANCRPFLAQEVQLLTRVRVVLVLGKIAFDGYGRMRREQGVDWPRLQFGHGVQHVFPAPLPALVASYHPSRQNTQTGRLTPQMLDQVLTQVKELIE